MIQSPPTVNVAVLSGVGERGMPVTTAHAGDALRALRAVGLEDKRRVYDALRCVLVSRPEDFAAFDELFARLFEKPAEPAQLRRAHLAKVPGVSETLDWAQALVSLHAARLAPQLVEETLGCVVKDEADLRKVRAEIAAGRLAT